MTFLLTAIAGLLAFVCLIMGGVSLVLALSSSKYRTSKIIKFALAALSASLCIGLLLATVSA
ncbi:MAG: hypothetical protein HWE27_15900 [Gammaproteobacteria bacterium]|nr:hypothetical protein [Gammaproteobacteria bacterium]